jgi:Ca2+-binding RTX toxin-like protein
MARHFGGRGADLLRGGMGTDLIKGYNGNDRIYGGPATTPSTATTASGAARATT